MRHARRLNWAAIALLAFTWSGLAIAADKKDAPDSSDLIAMHQKLYGQAAPTVNASTTGDANASDIDLIGLQRTVCSAKCPTYSVVINRSGRFRYNGVANVAHVGSGTGTVDPAALKNLLRYIDDAQFDKLAPGYVYAVTDMPSAFTWVRRGANDKVVWNYGAAGPVKLWAIEGLIDQLVATATWDQAATASASPLAKAKK